MTYLAQKPVDDLLGLDEAFVSPPVMGNIEWHIGAGCNASTRQYM